jgi:hypothetical protein
MVGGFAFIPAYQPCFLGSRRLFWAAVLSMSSRRIRWLAAVILDWLGFQRLAARLFIAQHRCGWWGESLDNFCGGCGARLR